MKSASLLTRTSGLLEITVPCQQLQFYGHGHLELSVSAHTCVCILAVKRLRWGDDKVPDSLCYRKTLGRRGKWPLVFISHIYILSSVLPVGTQPHNLCLSLLHFR